MAKKTLRTFVKVYSQAGTGYFYSLQRRKNGPKLELRKYDPHVRKHVLFNESKPIMN
ncbi:hypothetical protein MIR68_011332 [Amoeboaphelidium protococcarum]|nr:hypothetical protein MIR68_011332 [Amoeboaphelidium protococcarum]